MENINKLILDQMSHEVGNELQKISFMVDHNPSEERSEKIHANIKSISKIMSAYSNLASILSEKKDDVIEIFEELVDELNAIYSHKVKIMKFNENQNHLIPMFCIYAFWVIKSANAEFDLERGLISVKSNMDDLKYYLPSENSTIFAQILAQEAHKREILVSIKDNKLYLHLAKK